MSIQLQFVSEADIGSRTISWFSQGHFSHVDALLPDGHLLGSRHDWTCSSPGVVRDIPPGVRIRPPSYLNFSRRIVMTVPATDAQTKAFYDFLNTQIGKPYDSLAIVGFMIGRDWREDDSWICSELQTMAGETATILPRLYIAANKITPVACALAYSVLGGVVQEFTS